MPEGELAGVEALNSVFPGYSEVDEDVARNLLSAVSVTHLAQIQWIRIPGVVHSTQSVTI